MKDVFVYGVYVNGDSVEGRGPMIRIAYFDNHQEAVECAKGKGVMGVGDGDVRHEHLVIYETFKEFELCDKEVQTKKQALAKLTDEEKRVLGLL